MAVRGCVFVAASTIGSRAAASGCIAAAPASRREWGSAPVARPAEIQLARCSVRQRAIRLPPPASSREPHASSRNSAADAAASSDGGAASHGGGVVVVVGGGIIGLSTTQELLKRGFRAVNVAKSTDPRSTTSAVAAGFVFPYLLKPISQCEEWVRQTVEHCRDPPSPDLVHPMQAYALHIEHKVEGEPDWANCGLPYKRLSEDDIAALNANRPGWHPVVDGFLVDTFCFNTSAYLDWLVEDIRKRGGKFIPKTYSALSGVVADKENFDEPIRAIVNCTGVYANQIVCDTSVRPVYGQVISLKVQEGIDVAYVVEDGSEIMGGHAYMFPRKDKIICGGTAILDKWSEEPDDMLTIGIIDRVRRLVPELSISRELIIEQNCGLRPSRPTLRLEMELDRECELPVIHSYGHGGSGWTVFKGAACSAVDLVEQAPVPPYMAM